MKEHNTTKNLPLSERPYEKFIRNGPEALSDADLLAIIIKSGTKDYNSIEIATRILTGNQGNLLNLYDMSYKDLLEIDGIGQVKAIQLKAIAELSLRITKCVRNISLCLDSPLSIAEYYKESMRHLKRECVICAFFNIKNRFIKDEMISAGGVDYACFETREIFKRAIECNASAFVILHNHPSGDIVPSEEDIIITQSLCKAGEIMGIFLNDHIIIGDNQYFSFRESKYI